LTRHSTFLARSAALLAGACAILPAFAFNHVATVAPIAAGPFHVACSNIAQDASRIAAGASATDYWEGRDHYISELLTQPATAVTFNAAVPDQRSLYPANAGGVVNYVAIVCYPTPASNTDPDYVLPGTGDVIPHMQLAGAAPRLISSGEYAATFGIQVDPPLPAPQLLPLVVYSHGLTGSPISSGYVEVLVQLAAQGFMVAAPFHGDPRFSRVRVQDLSDVLYITLNFDHIVEMELMRPLSLKAMTDILLANPGYAAGIDTARIGGFGASLGGEAMTLLLGAQLTTTLGGHCADAAIHDPRVRAVVGYVPFAGWSFLPGFCEGQSGAASVNRPYLAMSGTADTTAPLTQMKQALNLFTSSRYMVELVDGQHELRPEDVGDLFTWMVTFFNAYLDVRADPGAMGRFVRMASVTGGRQDNLTVDVHVPFAAATGELAVTELYNSVLNHYYITTSASEALQLLNGTGSAWQLTGQGFKASPQPQIFTFLTSVVPVCRFDAYRRSGASSAFFTADAAECAATMANRSWSYAGTPWYIQPVDTQQRCPDGFIGVNRAYNQGFVRNDSNHRYSTSDSTMRDMERVGWAYEGTVMCSRP
jgi:Platelet-activating factor acetylhydrolase, isoform II